MTEAAQVAPTETAGAEPRPVPLRYVQHAIIGVAIALVSPFTALAWPFAILTGFVIGRSKADRKQGIRRTAVTTVTSFAAVTGGVLAMMIAGVFFGGLIAFIIVALAAFSERVAAQASPTDRTVARILVFVVALLGWIAIGLLFS
jgi:hypothetical protein